MAKRRTKTEQLARLRARLDVLTGKGTEQMRASLQAQIDALEKPKRTGGVIDTDSAPRAGDS